MADAPGSGGLAARDALYEQAAREFGGALHRLARAYEADADRRQDLLQDIHIALWRSFATFVSLDEAASMPDTHNGEHLLNREQALDRLLALIQTLKPTDRQVILLYLEGVDAGSIGEITGISSGNVATKIHRIKQILARRFHEGGSHDQSAS